MDATAGQFLGRCHWATVSLLAGALAGALIWPRVSGGALRHWDEAWYAEVSREMLAAGSWMTPLWNDEPWFHKPPLAFWATASAFAVFGVNEVAARLFSYGCAAINVGIIAALAAAQAKRLGMRHSLRVGWCAGLLLLAVPEFVRYAARGQLDAPLTLFATLQLAAFWLGRNDRRWRVLEAIAFGLALLTKGAAAGLAVAVEIGFVCIATHRRRWLDCTWLFALAAGVALAAPWHLHQYQAHGDRFLRDYGLRHFTQFFAEINAEAAPASPPKPTYYIDFLLRKQPRWGWIIIGLAGLAAATTLQSLGRRIARPSVADGSGHAAIDEWMCFLACWMLIIPIGLSCSRAKWSWYLVPMYPAYALFAAFLLARTVFWQTRSTAGLVGCLLLATLAAAEPFIVPANELNEPAIRDLAPTVRRLVPPDRFLYCLQEPRASRSVYPIACVFYFQRTMHTLHGRDHFESIVRRPGQGAFLLVADGDFATVAEKPQTSAAPTWRATVVERRGSIALFQIEPSTGPAP